MHRSQLDCPSFVTTAVSESLQPLSRAVYNELIHGKLTHTGGLITGGLVPVATLLRSVSYRLVDAVLTAVCQSHEDLLQPQHLNEMVYRCSSIFVAPAGGKLEILGGRLGCRYSTDRGTVVPAIRRGVHQHGSQSRLGVHQPARVHGCVHADRR